MCGNMRLRLIFAALFVFGALDVSWVQAANVVINGGTTTWSDSSSFSDGDFIYVNGNGTLEVTGNLSDKTAGLITLGDTNGGSNGTGELDMQGASRFVADDFTLGQQYDGILTVSSSALLTINDSITLNQGTVTNNGSLLWNLQTITWGNTLASDLVFDGTSGTIFFGTSASGEKFQLDGGTISTTGDLDANDFDLNGGTLVVNSGELTLDGDLSTVGTTIELGSGASWALGATQDATDVDITISGGTLTLGADTVYPGNGGTFDISDDGTIEMNDFDLTLGDADNFTIEDGSKFISATLGGSTLSWSSGTIRAAYDTFFTTFSVDDSNIALSGDAQLEIYDSGSDPYTVVYDFSLANTATVVGEDMILYVQGGANVTSTGGTNTADIQFLGRSDDPVIINSQATFEGDVLVSDTDDDDSKVNQIIDGVFEGQVSIQNWNDLTSDTIGLGKAVVSGGTFNSTVVLNLSQISTTDTVNRATISGGTFNDVLQFDGTGNANITGGTFDSLELLSTATGTLSIDGSVVFGGTDGVLISGGTLAGSGSFTGNVDMQAGTLAGSLAITGDVDQSGGTISPGDSTGDIETITITGNLNLNNATIDVADDGTSDQIDVTGSVELVDGGVMTITPDFDLSGLTAGIDYTVIQTTGGITDNGYSVDLGVAGYEAIGSIVGTDYIVTLQRSINPFPKGARNANNFVNYLYDLYADGEQQSQILDAIASDPNQQLAAEKFSGESHQTALQALMNVGIMRVNILTQQIRPNMYMDDCENGVADNSQFIARGQYSPPSTYERIRLWSTAYGLGGHFVGDENTSPNIVSYAGIMVGLEGGFGSGSGTIGAYYEGSGVDTNADLLSAKTSIKTNFFGGYLTRLVENGYQLFTFGFGEDRYSSRRYIDAGSGSDAVTELAKSGYHGWQSMVYAERSFYSTERFSGLQPYIGVQYSYIRRNAIDESSEDYITPTNDAYSALDFEATNYNSLRTYMGGRWETPFFQIGHDPRSGMMFGGALRAQTAWVHEILDKVAPICSAQLAGSALPNTFVVEGADVGRDWWLLSLGTNWQLSRTFSFYGDYTVLLNGRQTFHTGSGGLCLTW